MAYGIKYRLFCKGRDGITTKLVISEDGYSGIEIDRDVPTSPFILRKDSANYIQGTSLEFYIRELVDFEFIEFYTNNPKKYKILLYRNGRGSSITGVTADSTVITADSTKITADATIGGVSTSGEALLWSGYLNPQQYACKYISGPQNIRFQATDGLGLLKNKSFMLAGNQSELAIIMHCLDEISLGIGYAIAIGIHEKNQNASYPPLTQTYKNCEIYSNKNCYEVLEAVLNRYDATITQSNNRWRISSYKDKKLARSLYTSTGVYEGTEDAPTVFLLDTVRNAGYVRPSGYLNLNIQPGGKRVLMSCNYGRRESYLRNYDFSKYSSLMFADWTKSGSFTPTQLRLGDTCWAFIPTYSNIDTDYIQQEIAVTNVVGQGFIFEINVCAVGHESSSSTGLFPLQMEVRIEVSILIGSVRYYLSSSGWTTTPRYITETVTSVVFAGKIVASTIKISTLGLPGNGTLRVRCMRFKSEPPRRGTTYSGMAFSKVKIYFLNNGELYPDKFEETVRFCESSEPQDLEAIVISDADAPELINAGLLYDNITRLPDGTLTKNWNLTEAPLSDYTLIEALQKMLASKNKHARQVLRGRIKGDSLSFENLIKHEYNSNREYEITEGVWDVYEGIYDVKLVEWFPFIDQDVEYE
ncbi:MAG TPA: hypothetical protein PK727_04610 [Bacteroidales bacterium]|nr:hypothetical protein [Bacteroidales bacterium]HOG56590.1 hypothetical protein [Bacteroidales bacterium]